jgi:hypothetical protein
MSENVYAPAPRADKAPRERKERLIMSRLRTSVMVLAVTMAVTAGVAAAPKVDTAEACSYETLWIVDWPVAGIYNVPGGTTWDQLHAGDGFYNPTGNEWSGWVYWEHINGWIRRAALSYHGSYCR